MSKHTAFVPVSLLSLLWSSGGAALAGETPEPYVPDPDPDRPTLHVQPPAIPPSAAKAAVRARSAARSINAVSIIDVLTASGIDISGADYGNEPALAYNPLDPNQIVLTSFSGSNWGSGGNSSLFWSNNGGATWSYVLAVPPPPGTTTNISCPCDQNMDWGRDGVLYGTFLWLNTGGSVQSVYSAQATAPANPASWVYRTVAGHAQTTNGSGLIDVDQPWLMSGPLPGDNGETNVSVAYDNFDSAFANSQIRAADSPGFDPLDFTRDRATNTDGQVFNDGMNAGNRIAVGPSGLVFNVFQRYVGSAAGGVKQLTYLVTVSTDGGQTWSVGNSDHPSGAKIVAANVYSFQGNGSKVGGVNALLGGVTAITVDPSTGTAWIVYGRRLSPASRDLLWLVPVTYSGGNLSVGTARVLPASGTASSYLPAVAVLPNGEVGVLYLTWNGTTFTYQFIQTADGGQTIAFATTLAGFSSPFTDNGVSNQRIFGDYLQLKAVGCDFIGTYPARGNGVNSVNSIDPYFMRAPAATECHLPTPQGLIQPAVCAGGPASYLTVVGEHFLDGTTGRMNGVLRNTTSASPVSVNIQYLASDIANPGIVLVDVVGPAPGGILSASLPLAVESPAAPVGSDLMVHKGGSSVDLSWGAAAGASYYRVKRCTATTGPCTPSYYGSSYPATSYSDPVLNDGNSYWYLVHSANSCGEAP